MTAFGTITGLPGAGSIAGALNRANLWSPFLRRAVAAEPTLVARLIADGPVATWAVAEAAPLDDAAGLRAAKQQVAVVAALADLAGLWPLARVCAALSSFADRAIGAALAIAMAEAGLAGTDGFTVLALGKLGAGELNYSSDVDLILLHDRAAVPVPKALGVARRMVALLADRIAGQYVFRVDLRLRPASEATPLVIPVEAAESYYQSEALAWERIAFVRARACAGDIALGERFLAGIAPFVWRRSLDFNALADIRALSAEMRDAGQGAGAAGPGFDVKRGAGGIREIEFFAHAHQLIFGGRDAALRLRGTVAALDALADAGRIGRAEADALAASYATLRTVEHRIQMRGDEQTHRLPLDSEQARAVAGLAGLADADALTAVVAAATADPARLYAGLMADAPAAHVPREPGALRDWLLARGADEVDAVAARVGVWRSRRYRALRSPEALAGFEAVLPDLLTALLGDASAPGSLARFDAFLEALPSGVGLFGLMRANPAVAGVLARLLAVTPVLSGALARRPDLFDIVLEGMTVDGADPAASLEAYLGGAPIDVALDRMRRWAGERQFMAGARLLLGMSDPLAAGREYAAVADAVVRVAAARTAEVIATVHGRVEGGDLIVLAFGRFGGEMLTARSDLDLVFLFSGGIEGVSDGPKPLGATPYFNRLAQRLITALSAPTAAGALYEVDTRLRPSGTQGLLAVSLDSFAAYQREAAWTWERMALTRARVVGGDAHGASALLRKLLLEPRNPAALRGDVLAMRADMGRAHPGTGAWDVKHGRGGLIDLEFIVHYVQLRDRAGLTPDLGAAIAALGLPDALGRANDTQTRVLVMLRLLVAGAVDDAAVDALSPAAQALLAERCGAADIGALAASLAAARGDVLAAWRQVFGEERIT